MRKSLYPAVLGLALLAGLWSDASLAQPAQCGRTSVGASAPGTVLVVTGVVGSGIHLCGWDITATAVATFQLITGQGATCGTGTVNITAAHSISAGQPFTTAGATPGRYSAMSPTVPVPVVNNVCIIVGGTGPVQWTVYYTQF